MERSGDILKIRERDAVVCQQVNCVAVKPHGLSSLFVEAYGDRANVYGKRTPTKPGGNTAKLSSRPKPGQIIYVPPREGEDEPAIAHLVGQYMYGNCGNQRYRRIRMGENDEHWYLKTRENPKTRERDFKTCLVKLAKRVKRDDSVNTVYFPHRIGCGMAGGDWEGAYKPMIEKFADDIGKRVVIIKKE